jgi:hypothetical protein
MDKKRFEQAQSLLKEASKSQKNKELFKTPHDGTIDSAAFGEIFNKLIDAEEYIYSSRPGHYLSQENAAMFCGCLLDIRNKIDDMLAEFGVLEKENTEEEVKKLSENFLLLTSKGNFKKLLTSWGVEPQRIVVAGVPLEAEDMRLLNPKIPEKALGPIKKKISHVKNDITRKLNQFNIENMVVVVENNKPGEILAKRAEEVYGAKVIKSESLKDMNVLEFKRLLERC